MNMKSSDFEHPHISPLEIEIFETVFNNLRRNSFYFQIDQKFWFRIKTQFLEKTQGYETGTVSIRKFSR